MKGTQAQTILFGSVSGLKKSRGLENRTAPEPKNGSK